MPAFFEIGTNYCENVTLGWPDQSDNFFLHAYHRDGVPMISARIFSADRTLLFELLDNELTRKSLSGYRRIGFHNGWRIVDDDDLPVCDLSPQEGETPIGKGTVTHINGELFDKDGNQIAKASSKGLILEKCPFRMG